MSNYSDGYRLALNQAEDQERVKSAVLSDRVCGTSCSWPGVCGT